MAGHSAEDDFQNINIPLEEFFKQESNGVLHPPNYNRDSWRDDGWHSGPEWGSGPEIHIDSMRPIHFVDRVFKTNLGNERFSANYVNGYKCNRHFSIYMWTAYVHLCIRMQSQLYDSDITNGLLNVLQNEGHYTVSDFYCNRTPYGARFCSD